MDNWQSMDIPLKNTIKLRDELLRIDTSYNTEDGQIRWLTDNGYNDTHLGSFWSIIPSEVKSQMDNWQSMDIPLKNTIKLRDELLRIDTSYNTEDGQIRWLTDNNYHDVNLGSFWSIIPSEVKSQMNNWQKMDMPLQDTIKLRDELLRIDTSYNTEDGQIRWLTDNGYNDTHLGSFWSIIPSEVKSQMDNWQSMDIPLKNTIKLRDELLRIDTSYNTEDGQIRWLTDNDYHDINLGSFWSIIPSEVKSQMYNWQKMNIPLQNAIEIRKKLINIDTSYNTEDGQIRWLTDNGYHDINLGSFWSIIPSEVKAQMNNWKLMNMPLQDGKNYFNNKTLLTQKLKEFEEIYEDSIPYITSYLLKFRGMNIEEYISYIYKAIEKKSSFLEEVSLYTILETKKTVIKYNNLYSIADNLNMPRVCIHIILKNEGLNIRGINGISREGGRNIYSLSIDDNKGGNSTLKDTLSVSETYHDVSLEDLLLDFLQRHGNEIPEHHKEMLINLNSREYGEDDFIDLASTLRKFPELIEVLAEYL